MCWRKMPTCLIQLNHCKSTIFYLCRIKVETLESKETADYIYKEHDYHESVPLLPFWKKDVVLHSIVEFDLKNNVVKMRIDNKQPVTNFLGSRSK